MLDYLDDKTKLKIFNHVIKIRDIIRDGQCLEGEMCSYFDGQGKFGTCGRKIKGCVLPGLTEKIIDLRFNGKKLFYKSLFLLVLPDLEKVELVAITPRPSHYANDKKQGWTKDEIKFIDDHYLGGKILYLQKSGLMKTILESDLRQEPFYVVWDFSTDPNIAKDARKVFGDQSAIGIPIKQMGTSLGIGLAYFNKYVVEKIIVDPKTDKKTVLGEIFSFLLYTCALPAQTQIAAQRMLIQREIENITDITHTTHNLIAGLNPYIRTLGEYALQDEKDEKERTIIISNCGNLLKEMEKRYDLVLIINRISYNEVINDPDFQVTHNNENENLGKVIIESFLSSFKRLLFPIGRGKTYYRDAREMFLLEETKFLQISPEMLLKKVCRSNKPLRVKGKTYGLKDGVVFSFEIRETIDLKWIDKGSSIKTLLSMFFEEIYLNALKACPYPRDLPKKYINTQISCSPTAINIEIKNNYKPIRGGKPGEGRGRNIVDRIARILSDSKSSSKFINDPKVYNFTYQTTINNFVEEKKKRQQC